jgi:hypothetical protein
MTEAPLVCENEVHGCKDTCCCGDHMDNHADPMSCGHSPVSMHDWHCCRAYEREYGDHTL